MIALFAVAHAEEETATDPTNPCGGPVFYALGVFYDSCGSPVRLPRPVQNPPRGYTHPLYHHLAAPVYAHHPPVYHHAPVYTHYVAPVVYTAANVCKNEGGQLVPCAHGIAPGSAIYAMANAPGYVPTVAAAPPAEDVVSVEKRDVNPNAEPDDDVRRVFPLLLLFTPPSSELEDIGKFKGIEALSENQS